MNKKDLIKKEYLASFVSCLSTNHKSISSNNNLNNSSSKINSFPITYDPKLSTKNFNKLQSPKITSIQKRCSSQPKLFSLLDINDKITNKKSTDLPMQYKRRSPEEIKQLLNYSPKLFNQTSKLRKTINYEEDLKKRKNNQQQGLSNSMLNKNIDEFNVSCFFKNNLNSNNNSIIKAEEGDNNNSENSKQKNENNSHKEELTKENEQNINNYLEKMEKEGISSSRNKRLYRPYIFDKNSNELNYKKIPNDKYKPKYLDFCENLKKKESCNKHKQIQKQNIRDFHRSNSLSKNNKLDNSRDLDTTLPLLFHKEMKKKTFGTDIFFLKQQEQLSSDISTNKSNIKMNNLKYSYTQKFLQSDIFLLKNDEISRNKSGEKSLYKIRPTYKYTSSRESNSMWNTKNLNLMPPLLNHSSSEHHILNPSLKNISQTKEQIAEKFKEMNISRNLANKQKGLSEFIDLSRISAPNLNKDYLDMYSKDQKVFAKRNDICSDFNEMYGKGYSKLCDKPFQQFQAI